MGIVYRARDLSQDRDVAIKIINAETANALSIGQFAREAQISSQFHHPHITAVYEICMDDPFPYIVMELLHGRSLADENKFTYSRIIDIGRQICDALEYIHGQGYVYRDLKPANVILEKQGFKTFVKLLDFGLARPRGEDYLPNESSLAGTVFYLAPELIKGQPADIGSDLYALGALLYEMVTGRVPFSNINEQNIITQHLEDKVSPPSESRNDVPPELESIILRLLEKDPRERFASAGEVLNELAKVKLSSASSSRGNLPKIKNDSQEEAARIIQLMESNKLVTLLNKDESLAEAVGSQLNDQFKDGVWLVQLDSIQEPTMVLPVVSSVLGVSENPKRPPALLLIEFLREKNLLLILGHCGHLAGACAQLAATILSNCPEVRILAVSQRSLNIPEEQAT
jgi:serine/threonine-protein kinase